MTDTNRPDLPFDEGDHAALRVKVARANSEQALIGFQSMEGPYSIRVPLSELTLAAGPDEGARLARVVAVLTEWGALASDDDEPSDEDFAEAVHESGAWRLARDLRKALAEEA